MIFLKKEKNPGDGPVQTSHLTTTQTQFLRFVKNRVKIIFGAGLSSIKGSVHQRGVKMELSQSVLCTYCYYKYIYVYLFIYLYITHI